MNGLILKQLRSESDTWKRSLDFIREENIHLKSRLTEILKVADDKSVLEIAEIFQNKFIKEDERASLIRNDVAEIDNLLVKDGFEDNRISRDVNIKLSKVRNNVLNAEKHLSDLKSEFSTFILETVFIKNS